LTTFAEDVTVNGGSDDVVDTNCTPWTLAPATTPFLTTKSLFTVAMHEPHKKWICNKIISL
jgi:hypothetical protein